MDKKPYTASQQCDLDKSLRTATKEGDLAAVKNAIANGADVNSKSYWEEWTALHYASNLGYIEIAKELIQAGADVNVITSYKATPLHLASRSSFTEIARGLIEAGADVNVTDTYQQNPIHLATGEGSLEIVRWLIQAGADVNAFNNVEAPLHIASRMGNLEIVRELLQAGADTNAMSIAGQYTPLRLAIMYDHPEIVRELEHYGTIGINNPLQGISQVGTTGLNHIRELEAMRSTRYMNNPLEGLSIEENDETEPSGFRPPISHSENEGRVVSNPLQGLVNRSVVANPLRNGAPPVKAPKKWSLFGRGGRRSTRRKLGKKRLTRKRKGLRR